jgi:8-oxo-dGTP diphosphatase
VSGHSAEKDAGPITEYVVGFAFDTDGRVALIRKNRPEWQAGRLNGIGGHIEPGEHPNDAMWREFREETGTDVSGWQKYVVMDFPGARIHFYRLRGLLPRDLDGLRSMTDEEVVLAWPGDANWHLMIPNLMWLIPLAAYTADDYELIHVRASMAEALTVDKP